MTLPMTRQGRVRWFAEHKGYGYLEADDGTEVYVHHRAIVGTGFRTLRPGQRVAFRMLDDGRGPAAQEVRVVQEDGEDATGSRRTDA